MRTKVNENLFEGQPFYVGIDCHKKSWKVTILGQEYEHKTMSQNPEPEVLAGYLRKNFPGGTYRAVYEAGFSGFESCRQLRALGVDCVVIHPADVPSSQKEKLQKTDAVDSRKLARSLRGNELEAIHLPEQYLEADRALIRQRFRVVRDISRTKNRVKSLLFQFGVAIPESFTAAQTRHWSKRYTDWLRGLAIKELRLRQTLDNYLDMGERQREHLLVVNKQVRDLARSATYERSFSLMVSIPGIGMMTAMTYLVQLGDIRRFKTLDDLCSYVGLVPRMYGSGDKMQTGRMVKRGRKEMKIMLIEASWEAIRKDPALMAKFNELAKRMNKNKAIIRIARKMLSRIRYVLTNQQPYELGVVV